MHLIQVEHVVEAVMEYYDAKILPPIGENKKTALETGLDTTLPAQGTPLELFREPLELVPAPTLQPTPELSAVLSRALRTPTTMLIPPPEFTRGLAGPQKEQISTQKRLPVEFKRVQPVQKEPSYLDLPHVGGKITICVLCHGDYLELAKRCLGGILKTVPRDCVDLRVGANAACDDTLKYVRSVEPDMLYVNTTNRMKYPAMREMFHDSAKPLTTAYTVWFDDDTYIVDPHWLKRLAAAIAANHKQGCRLYGMKLFHDLATLAQHGHRPDRWFSTSPWYRGVPFNLRSTDQQAPNGSCINFAAGWFWACETETIRRADIPDVRLNHNGGEIAIGAQVAQLGFKVKDFNKGKSLVFTPSQEQGGRRSYEESYPWVAPSLVFSHTLPRPS